MCLSRSIMLNNNLLLNYLILGLFSYYDFLLSQLLILYLLL